MEDHLPPLREVIAAHGLRAKKSLGQNFLFDLNLTRRIARGAGPLESATIYEVGPGPDEHALLGSARVRIAANLPYNIGTALLVKWLTVPAWPPFWDSLTLMFQREVAQRIVAKPDSDAYGRLSVLAQWRTKPKILFDVARSAFVPPPKITSSIVRLEPLSEPVAPAQLADLERVTAAAFGQRRKMLRQSLKPLAADAEARIRVAGIDPTQRPEQLSVAAFASLARHFSPSP
jgi:16S rRNA (adenine1518-N6/adenine1519-N6)-dimethyltransferase